MPHRAFYNAEVAALRQRIEVLEGDLQHKSEIISVLLDRETRAQARLRELRDKYEHSP